MDLRQENLELLQKNWMLIQKKVIIPLWKRKFKSMYEHSKMDYDDFESLAALEITRAMGNFNSQKSSLFTYATNVLQQKAKTELTFYHREKRVGDIEAESISKLTDEDAQITLEDLLTDIEKGYEDAENCLLSKEILRSLKNNKERKIISLSIQGYDDENIAERVNTTTEKIRNLRKRLSETPAMRRVLRKIGCSLGGIEL